LDPAWHGPDTSTQRGSLSFCVAVLALASLCFGCGHVESPPLPLHSLTEGIRASPGLPEVVVHFFKDMRAGAEPNQAGIRYLESRGSGSGFTGKPLLVSPPDSAVTVIARAFARGLAARGFSVVDRTAIPTRASGRTGRLARARPRSECPGSRLRRILGRACIQSLGGARRTARAVDVGGAPA
jgi:hypothetical protein